MAIESFEQTQKINALAKELLKHHVVSSADEAFKRAEATVRSGSSEQFIAKGPAAASESQQQDAETARDVRQLKFALVDLNKIISKLNSDMSSFGVEISNVKSELSMMKGEVSLLKQKLRDAHNSAPAAPLRSSSESSSQIGSSEAQASAQFERIIRPKEPEAAKPVEIDKIFYFGKK